MQKILDHIRSLLLEIEPQDYEVEPIRKIYAYPTDLIPVFPSITLELDTAERVDETLGDNRFIERYTVVIKAFISYIDSKENYTALLSMDRAIRAKM